MVEIPVMSIPENNIISVPKIRNGAKGISLFIVTLFVITFNRLINMKKSPTIAPIIKAKKSPERANFAPRSHPVVNASFASPKPIARPFESHQKRKKNMNKMGPAARSRIPKVVPKCESGFEINNKISAATANGIENVSGIILCFKS